MIGNPSILVFLFLIFILIIVPMLSVFAHIHGMISVSFTKSNLIEIKISLTKIKASLKENVGLPFMIVFQTLIIHCVFLLALGAIEPANVTAIYAYNFLVLGVILQFINFLKD